MSAVEPFRRLVARGLPLAMSNVDTDRISPARFAALPVGTDRAGCMFYDLRFDEQGQPRADSVFHHPGYAGARILVADALFGCGSSRESAVWALRDYGFKCIVASSFGDIFWSNCFKNAVLPVVLAPEPLARLRRELIAAPGGELEVDLEHQTLRTPSGTVHAFEVDGFRKQCLLEGLDDLSLTGRYAEAIAAFEARHLAERPWLARREGDG